MQIKGKVILVTGGGSGIGRNLVLELVNRGAEVAAIDINEDALKETVSFAGKLGEKISTFVVNIADREAVEALPEKVIAHHGAIDGIINNAGIIQPFVKIKDLSYDVMERVVNVNLWGPIYITKSFLPYLMERPVAHIVNISSMGGFFPFPGQTMYGATKAGVKLFTEGLYAELQGTNVHVTVVFPGAIDTNISKNSGIDREALVEDEAASGAIRALPADQAAKIILDGVEKDKYKVLVGSDAKMMDVIYKLNPKAAVGFISKQMGDLIAD